MSVIEFHPDDLLDRELKGTLSDADRVRLAAHLERCAVCRLECQLRFDFEQELGPSQPASDLQPVVSDVLRAAGAKPAVAPPQARSAPPSMQRWAAAGLVACALFGSVVAAAQLGLTETMLEWMRGDGVPSLHRPAPRVAMREQPAAVAVAKTSVVSTQEMVREVAAPAAPATTGPSRRLLEQPRRDLSGRSPAFKRAEAKRTTLIEASRSREQEVEARNAEREQSGSKPIHAASGPEALPVAAESGVRPVALPGASARGDASVSATAATLFELASRARRSGASEEAGTLYRQLQARFPRSPEARLSVALLARLQLDRGELAAALASFDVYLDTAHRALREEAMVGRARTLERLGRERDAEHAWRDLLEAYPRSAAAATAQRRLGQSTP